jgi:hypothetical protein
MNRWYASAAGVLVAGVAVAFLVVPFDDGACPTGADACQAYGSAPRIGTLIVTALVALMLAAIGSAGASGPRLR